MLSKMSDAKEMIGMVSHVYIASDSVPRHDSSVTESKYFSYANCISGVKPVAV